jgi:lipoprotein-anchoring transpeptidase ErfK/SrfK
MQIRIHVPSQTLDLIDGNEVIRCYAVSTSRFGTGSESGSYKTPVGQFRIAEKIGEDAPPGEIFVGRVPTGGIGEENDEEDHVQTRILWLDGLEPENANTHERYIYIHGTNAESRIGTPASLGCIRMSNLDVIDLYDRVTVGASVEIQP